MDHFQRQEPTSASDEAKFMDREFSAQFPFGISNDLFLPPSGGSVGDHILFRTMNTRTSLFRLFGYPYNKGHFLFKLKYRMITKRVYNYILSCSFRRKIDINRFDMLIILSGTKKAFYCAIAQSPFFQILLNKLGISPIFVL